MTAPITFRVNLLDYQNIYKYDMHNQIDNIVNQLKHATVWVEGVPRALKHGDTFTLYGLEAIRVKNLYIGQSPQTLEIVSDTPNIYVLINTNYIDYVSNVGDNVGDEANNLLITLRSQGYNPFTFTDISASGWTTVTEAAGTRGIIMIPEIEENDLNPDLSSGARTIIADWVSSGGSLVMFEPDDGDVLDILNDTFGFSLNTNSVTEPIALTAEGMALAAFADGPSTIPAADATDSLDTSTLPTNSITIYAGDSSNESVVTLITYGTGRIFVLGWDWYDAAPQGGEDGGWLDVLQRFINSRI